MVWIGSMTWPEVGAERSNTVMSALRARREPAEIGAPSASAPPSVAAS